jgi:ergothioneine biosynthesis protein EgtB
VTASDPVDTTLAARYRRVRDFSLELCAPLSSEDCAIQSMPDVSPTRWHLAHTTWFFETFILAKRAGYECFDPNFNYLFNSYYNAIGDQFPRSHRGLLSRPSLPEVLDYRRSIDEHMAHVFESEQALAEFAKNIEVGLNHEQQHQELMLTDIKHVLAQNPLHPVYRDGNFEKSLQRVERLQPAVESRQSVESLQPVAESRPQRTNGWMIHPEGVYRVGQSSEGFHFDNESPCHREFVEAFELNRDLVGCGDYIQFIEDGGYRRPELWLSLGWDFLRESDWRAPLYWQRDGSDYYQFTLAGRRAVDPDTPVCHVSYFEADAFARWAHARLPTEAEWELASVSAAVEGGFVDALLAEAQAIHPAGAMDPDAPIRQLFGDVWEWTASPYVAYPGFAPTAGALGEYNGKFMCNQYVLRGGSCATSSDHVRRTYRNFFPPQARWQFSGIRLARDSQG